MIRLEQENELKDREVLNTPSKYRKPVVVKGLDFEKEFESISDTMKYFKGIGIQLDRKYLYTKMKDGTSYKGYYFYYK